MLTNYFPFSETFVLYIIDKPTPMPSAWITCQFLARNPCLQHGRWLVGGCAPEPLPSSQFIPFLTKSIIPYTFYIIYIFNILAFNFLAFNILTFNIPIFNIPTFNIHTFTIYIFNIHIVNLPTFNFLTFNLLPHNLYLYHTHFLL